MEQKRLFVNWQDVFSFIASNAWSRMMQDHISRQEDNNRGLFTTENM